MKLSDGEIQFIDNYLKHSGIAYEDIRFEMTDHVAAALEEQEGDFYDNFKSYMSIHKASLLDANKRFKKTATHRALQALLANMMKPLPMLAAIVAGYAIYRGAKWYGNDTAGLVLDAVYITLLLITVFFVFRHRYYVGQVKYSVADKLFWGTEVALYWLTTILRPYHFGGNEVLFSIFAVLLLYSGITAFYTFVQLMKMYRLKMI